MCCWSGAIRLPSFMISTSDMDMGWSNRRLDGAGLGWVRNGGLD